MNNQKEDIKRAAEVAQFRFGVIAPVVQDLYPDPSRTAYYKRVASSPFTLPDGSVVEYNYKTIEKWVSMYQRGGLEALMPHMYSVFKAVLHRIRPRHLLLNREPRQSQSRVNALNGLTSISTVASRNP